MTIAPDVTGNDSATSPKRYQPGDPCPEVIESTYDWHTGKTIKYDPPAPCGGILEKGWGPTELRCRGGLGSHYLHQCQQCGGPITKGRYGRPRSDAVYCSTRCRVAAHRARRAEAAAQDRVTQGRSPSRNSRRR